jgi:acyl homoserine lactone synthase
MIDLILGEHRKAFPRDIEEMHRLRHRVFKERLDWEVNSEDGQERDWYDNYNPAYMIYRNAENKIGGCLRLLPTTGPNMLANTFDTLLDGARAPASPYIWESSRFSVDFEIAGERSETGLNRATCELLCGILEFGLARGLTDVASVFDIFMEKILRRAGCPAKRIGQPQRLGKAIAVAGLFEISEQALVAARAAGGIEGPVLRTYAWPLPAAA